MKAKRISKGVAHRGAKKRLTSVSQNLQRPSESTVNNGVVLGGSTRPWALHLDDSSVVYWGAVNSKSKHRNPVPEQLRNVALARHRIKRSSVVPSKSTVQRNVYAALHEVLQTMGRLNSADPHSVDRETKESAEKLLNFISHFRHDPPKIMSHGGDAVTFTWDEGGVGRYITVSGDEAHHLDIEKVSRHKFKLDVDLNDLDSQQHWLEVFGGNPTSTSVLDDAG